jgi:hypothetical protein
MEAHSSLRARSAGPPNLIYDLCPARLDRGGWRLPVRIGDQHRAGDFGINILGCHLLDPRLQRVAALAAPSGRPNGVGLPVTVVFIQTTTNSLPSTAKMGNCRLASAYDEKNDV